MSSGQGTHYKKAIILPYTRIRTIINTVRGDIVTLVVKLEYNVSEEPALSEQWKPVARFDHNPDGQYGHDIIKEGLHLDLCLPGKDDKKIRGFPRVPLNLAPKWCEGYFEENHLRLTKRFCYEYGFEKWNQPTNR